MEQVEEKKRKIKYISIIVVAAILYLLNAIVSRQKVFLNTDSDTEIGCTDLLINGRFVEQNIYAEHDFEMALQLCVITWDAVYDNDDLLMLSIVERETGEVICTTEYQAKTLIDHRFTGFIIFEGTELKAGHSYSIRVESNITDENKPIALACVENTVPEVANVICNGEIAAYNLRMKIYEM